MAGKFLLGDSETMGPRGCLANRPRLKPSYLPHLSQIRLRQHPEIPFLEEAFPSESLRQEGGGSKLLSHFS